MDRVVFLTGIMQSERSWPLLFAKGLAEHGMNTTIICGYPNYNFDPKYREYQLAHPVEKLGENLDIIRVGSRKLVKDSLIYRFLWYVKLTFDIKKEIKNHDANIYFIYSTPPFLGLLGKSIKKKGKKAIYIAQDLFPDNLFSIKPRFESGIIGKTLRILENRIYSSCTEIVTASQTMKQTISQRGVSASRIKVIYNWSDIKSLNYISRDKNDLFDEYGIEKKKFIVSYAGSLGHLQNINILLDVAIKMRRYTDLLFVIFGRGSCESLLKKRVQNEGINNVIILPMQPKEKVAAVYSVGDVEYVSVKPGVMRIAAPHKILDVMSVGRPILAVMDKDCDIAEKIENKEIGIVVSCEVNEIETAILSLYNNKDLLIKMGENSRLFAEQIDYDSQINRYLSLIN